MLLFCRNRTYLAISILLLFLAPAVAFGQIAWVEDFDDALKQAAREKKFIVLDLSASW